MAVLDHAKLRQLLLTAFLEAEAYFREGNCPILEPQVEDDLRVIFESSTQAYREVLIGCSLVSIEYQAIDLTKPYTNQGPNAFNGRSLDEIVVNPFLHEKRIPSSRGPYLSTFRRSVDFTGKTRQGVRDKVGFDSLLSLIESIKITGVELRRQFLVRLLCEFVRLREATNIPLSKLNRASASQYDVLLRGLLKVPSGGRIPVIVVIAVLNAIKVHFNLGWLVEFQGINEADAAGGAGGDVTVRLGETVILAAEITEREVDKARVVATFTRKISPAGIRDYIFFAPANAEAIAQANQYFAQGSEVNFVDIRNWAHMSLVTMGQTGREAFNAKLTETLEGTEIPKAVKVAWNELVANITNV